MVSSDFIFGKHFRFNGGIGVSNNMNDDFSNDYEAWLYV
jgi:hypothetical protein